jgi:cytidylate kinase
VAEALGYRLLDSGALYRLTGLAGRRAGLEATDAAGHARVAGTMGIEFGSDERGGEQVLLDGEPVTDLIRTETAGNLASVVASLPAVRAALLERQRAFARPPGLVADGRDMGTIVFPDAELKIFLTASAEERAHRRYKQLKDKGLSVSLADLSREIAERDHRDASRALAPLVPAPDAISLDSTGVSPEDVVARVLALARRRLLVTDPAGGPGTGVD